MTDERKPGHSPPFLEMRNVVVGSMREPAREVARVEAWTVSPGDYWAIAGLEGSGKSDLLMMTAGLMAPQSGDYSLFGEPMPIFEEARLRQRLRVGLAFEGGQLFNRLTIQENVMLPARYHQNLSVAEAEAATRELLEATQLSEYAHTPAGRLGRPWQRRAGLARALALKPELLLVDNPLGGLDLRHAQWWLDFLGTLSTGSALTDGRALTLVVTTSDLRVWKDRARQFAVLKERRFIVPGAWAEVEKSGDGLVSERLATGTEAGPPS